MLKLTDKLKAYMFIKKFFTSIVTSIVVFISVLSLSLIFFRPIQAQLINIDDSFTVDNGYKVGTIKVLDSYSLPRRMSADINSESQDIYNQKNIFLSTWTIAKSPFHALSVSWNEELPENSEVEISVRTRKLNGQNSRWMHIHADIDNIDSSQDNKNYSFIKTAWSTQIQYRIELRSQNSDTTPTVENLEFVYIDSTGAEIDTSDTSEVSNIKEGKTSDNDSNNPLETISEITESNLNLLEVSGLTISNNTSDLPIITRRGWGADEKARLYTGLGKPELLEFEGDFKEKYKDELEMKSIVRKNKDKKYLTWPLQYPKGDIKTIFIHHTASQDDAMNDSKATVRAIYYYHTNIRGWGDIGYNYLIDENGAIFEGRYGGDKVVGAHVKGFNVGSIGIALIGNYQENELKFASVDSLIQLLTNLCLKYDLDPTGITSMRGKSLHVISGHRDAAATACPGQHTYDKLPFIRQLVKSAISRSSNIATHKSNQGLDFFDIDERDIVVLGPNDTKTITLKLKNTGTKTWNRRTKLIYKNTNNNVAGLHESVANLSSSSVAPGQIGAFKIPLKGTFKSGLKNYYLYLQSGSEISENNILFPVYIEPINVSFKLISIDKPLNSNLEKKESTSVTFTVKNTGNIPWSSNNISLISTSANSLLTSGNMINKTQILPGSTAKFKANFKAGNTSGQFNENLKIVVNDTFGNRVVSKTIQTFSINIKSSTNDNRRTIVRSGEPVIITDRSSQNNFKPGEKKRVWIEVMNNSNSRWERIGGNRLIVTLLKSPLIKTGPVIIQNARINKGERTKISFDITAPRTEGSHFVNMIFRSKDGRLTKSPLRYEFSVSKNGQAFPSTQPNKTIIPVVSNPIHTNQRTLKPTTPSPDHVINAVEPPISTVTTNVSPTRTSNMGDNIRIALSFYDNPIITSDSNMRIYDSSGKHLNNGAIIKAGTHIKIKKEKNNYRVSFGNKSILTNKYIRIGSDNGILRLVNFEHRPEWNKSLNDNEYRGVFEVRKVDNQLRVINELPLEYYLMGLGEVSNSDPIEKIKTILVLARSYAYYYMTEDQKFAGKPYHLDDNPAVSQKYLGYGLEKRAPNLVAAVNKTKGKVVTYKEHVIKTPYFNTTDGTFTKSAEEVWGWTNTPYLVPVDDSLCESDQFRGHGVGLSGCGATAMSKQGKTYNEIIKYYYKGVKLQTKY